jgi:hypothetical protein
VSELGNDGNPFSEQVVSEYFVGREEELSVFEKNLLALKSGAPNHCFVAGIEGTGKTAYLNKIVDIAVSQNCIGVLLSLDPVPAYRQISTILRTCIDALQKQTAIEGEPPRRELLEDWDAGLQSKLFRHPRQDVPITVDVKQDFDTLAAHVKATGRGGVVICIDEGQRIEPNALSVLKNSLNSLGSFLIVLSLRLVSDTRGAVQEGRQQLDDRAQTAEGDIGASRFYVTGTAMGPFKTDDEIKRLFAARLRHKKIQFSDEVTMRLGNISEKVPGRIIHLAAHLYNRALAEQIEEVQPALLDDCFQDRYPDQMKQAVDLCANLSSDLTDLVKALCSLKTSMTALDIAKHAYPAYSEAVLQLIAQGAAFQLDRLCISSPLLQRTEDKYKITNSVYQYALRLALKLT